MSVSSNAEAFPGAVPSQRRLLLPVLFALLVLSLVAASLVGTVSVNLSDLVRLLLHPFADDYSSSQIILHDIRIPRVLLAAITGAALGSGGAAIQGIFRNPLAEPALIGVSAGAALAVALMLVFFTAFNAIWLQPLFAFAGGLATTWLIWRISQRSSYLPLASLLLAGIAINAVAGALLSLLSYLGSDAQLRQILLWMLGGFDRASWPVLLVATIWILPAIVLMQRFAVALNVFTLGEAEAFHLGLRPERVKWQVLLLVAVMVGAAVSAAGVIGFVGLVVPHVLRLLAGPDHRLLLPASALLGAILLVWADLAARLLLAPAELPVGILTALIGAPFFLWLLLRQRHAGNLS